MDYFYCMPSTRSFSNLLYDICCHASMSNVPFLPRDPPSGPAPTQAKELPASAFGARRARDSRRTASASTSCARDTHESAVHQVSRYTQSWPRAGVSGYHATRAHGKHGRFAFLARRSLERSAKPIYALPTAARGASPASRLAWHPRAARRPAPSARASAGPLSLAKARGERVGSASLRRSVAPRFEWRIGGSWIRMAVTHCSEG